jgi:hypothetical protein
VVTGNYQQTSGGTLNVSLTGNPADPGPLTVGGTAYLAGTLHASFPPGFVPQPGQHFAILQSSAVYGQFAIVTRIPGFGSGTTLAPEYGGQVVALAASQPVVFQVTTSSRPVVRDDLGTTVLIRPDSAASSQLTTQTEQALNPLLGHFDGGNHLGATAVFNQPAVEHTDDASTVSGGGSTGRVAFANEVLVVPTAAEQDVETAALDPAGVLVTLADLESPPAETLSGSDIAGSLLTGSRPGPRYCRSKAPRWPRCRRWWLTTALRRRRGLTFPRKMAKTSASC